MTSIADSEKLPIEFYQRPVLTVARELLGKVFVRKIYGKSLSGRIVEVEAYDGSEDEASHSFKGPTERNRIMFKAGGLLYVYFTYGMYHCANVVTGKADEGCAVLIRGIEPLDGIAEMRKYRYPEGKGEGKKKTNLTNGPGKICMALNIGLRENGTDLTGNKIYLLKGERIDDRAVGASERIGISRSVHLKWRFFIKNNPYLSRK